MALFIDNRDKYCKHVSYSVLVRYGEEWYSASGDTVAKVKSVGKDAVVMVWAVRVQPIMTWAEFFELST